MNTKKMTLSALLAVCLSWEAHAAMNESCSSGDLAGGRQTERDDGKAMFFDLLINQDAGGQCTLHVAIDTPSDNVADWTAYITDEQISLSNERIVNQVIGGRFEVTVPGQAGVVYPLLQRLDTGEQWQFPDININARQ